MITFLKNNKSLITYFTIFIAFTMLFGFNFLISLIGNVLLLLFLVPLLLVIVFLISFSSLKSKLNTCNQCGTLSLGINNTCMSCGADLNNIMEENFQEIEKPSETTIEVKAEEIK